MKNHKKARKVPYLSSHGFAFSEKSLLYDLKAYSSFSLCENILETSLYPKYSSPREIVFSVVFFILFIYLLCRIILSVRTLSGCLNRSSWELRGQRQPSRSRRLHSRSSVLQESSPRQVSSYLALSCSGLRGHLST